MSKFIKLFSCVSILTLTFAGVDAMNVNNANTNNAGGVNGQNVNAQQKIAVDDFLEFVHDKVYFDYCVRTALTAGGQLNNMYDNVDWNQVPGSTYRSAINWGRPFTNTPNLQILDQNTQGLDDEALKAECIAFLKSHNAESILQLIERYPTQKEHIQNTLAQTEAQYIKIVDDMQTQMDTLRAQAAATLQPNNQ